MTQTSTRLLVLVLSAVAVQLSCHYFGLSFNQMLGMESQSSFRWLHFLSRNLLAILFVPLVVQSSFKECGFGAPSLSKKMWGILGLGFVLLTLAVVSLRWSESYMGFYSGSFAAHHVPVSTRIISFGIFTFSTLIGWEVLHRGLLLFGIFRLLKDEGALSEKTAQAMAIATVAVFESIFHMVKPPAESFGLMIGSPLLSWLAFKSKSMWPSLLIHLYIESVFILVMVL